MTGFYAIPGAILALIHGALLAAALAGGFYLGRRRDGTPDTSGSGLTLTAALIGLVGLLLGFSFSMASTRYDLRKAAVVKEANSVATTYLRTELLDTSNAAELRKVLRRYVDARISLHEEATQSSDAAHAQVTARTVELRRELWLSLSNATKQPQAPPSSSLIPLTTSLNQMIEAACERDSTHENRVPDEVLVLLMLVSVAACVLLGFENGRERHLNVVPLAVFAVSLVVVVATIVDLDRPSRGLIRIGQEPMLRLRADVLDH